MRRRRIGRGSALGLALVAMTLAPVVSALPAQALDQGIQVSLKERADLSLLAVVADGGFVPGAADLLIGSAADPAWVRIDPDSGREAFLIAGAGCRFGAPASSTEAYPTGTSVICDAQQVSGVDIDMRFLGDHQGELIIVNASGLEASFRGSAFDDYYQGGDSADIVEGLGGADTLFGGNGADWIYGGDGADLIDGEGDEDILWGGRGPDEVTAVEGNGRPQVADEVNCNDWGPARGSDNSPGGASNSVEFTRGLDVVTDCGVKGAPSPRKELVLPANLRVGAPATVSDPRWQGRNAAIEYNWYACSSPALSALRDAQGGIRCERVGGGTGKAGRTYTPTSLDAGTYLVVQSVASNPDGTWAVETISSDPVRLASLSITCSQAKPKSALRVTCKGQVKGSFAGFGVTMFTAWSSEKSWTTHLKSDIPVVTKKGTFTWKRKADGTGKLRVFAVVGDAASDVVTVKIKRR